MIVTIVNANKVVKRARVSKYMRPRPAVYMRIRLLYTGYWSAVFNLHKESPITCLLWSWR
jgi:hypothetical protein